MRVATPAPWCLQPFPVPCPCPHSSCVLPVCTVPTPSLSPWSSHPSCPLSLSPLSLHCPCVLPVLTVPPPSLSPGSPHPSCPLSLHCPSPHVLPVPCPYSPHTLPVPCPRPAVPPHPHVPESPTVRAMEGEAPGSGGAGGHFPVKPSERETPILGTAHPREWPSAWELPPLGTPSSEMPQFWVPRGLPLLTWERGSGGRQRGRRRGRGRRSLHRGQDRGSQGLLQGLGLGRRRLGAGDRGRLRAVVPPESLVLLLDHPAQRVHLVARVLVGLLGTASVSPGGSGPFPTPYSPYTFPPSTP